MLYFLSSHQKNILKNEIEMSSFLNFTNSRPQNAKYLNRKRKTQKCKLCSVRRTFTNLSTFHFYPHHQLYLNRSRVSVLRGQVITSQGLGIVGVRVSVDMDSRFGFTLTRNGGWYVNLESTMNNYANHNLVNAGSSLAYSILWSAFPPTLIENSNAKS